jgi:PII-like signaling protein
MSKFIGDKVLMRIHISENDKHGRRPLYEALVDVLMHEGFAGATVLRGVSGFGPHLVYHTDRLLELAKDLPMIVEVVAAEDKLEAIMPKIDAMMSGGLITFEKVRVVRYCDKNDKVCELKEP